MVCGRTSGCKEKLLVGVNIQNYPIHKWDLFGLHTHTTYFSVYQLELNHPSVFQNFQVLERAALRRFFRTARNTRANGPTVWGQRCFHMVSNLQAQTAKKSARNGGDVSETYISLEHLVGNLHFLRGVWNSLLSMVLGLLEDLESIWSLEGGLYVWGRLSQGFLALFEGPCMFHFGMFNL